MTEATIDLRCVPKVQAYADLEMCIGAVLEGLVDEIAAMATMCSLIHQSFGHLWTGFYRVVEPGRLLRVGPYQGTLGCIEIPFGQGVCGTAAAQEKTVLVPHVSLFPGHITCDARARSEIVVPVFGRRNELVAVLDVDSDVSNAFDDEDRRGLERIVRWFARSAERR
jgi:L-methionine (R)-S-oxide reductase